MSDISSGVKVSQTLVNAFYDSRIMGNILEQTLYAVCLLAGENSHTLMISVALKHQNVPAPTNS